MPGCYRLRDISKTEMGSVGIISIGRSKVPSEVIFKISLPLPPFASPLPDLSRRTEPLTKCSRTRLQLLQQRSGARLSSVSEENCSVMVGIPCSFPAPGQRKSGRTVVTHSVINSYMGNSRNSLFRSLRYGQNLSNMGRFCRNRGLR
jgi:hypothetical protein